MINNSQSTSYICDTIIPTNIKVFYENKRPYISYKGIFRYGNDEYEIEIPKMDMVLQTVEAIVDRYYAEAFDHTGSCILQHQIGVRNEFYAHHDIAYTIKRIKSKMTKEEIEKELGYKIDIVD